MIWFKLFIMKMMIRQPFHQDIDYSIIIELSANVLTILLTTTRGFEHEF